MFGDITSPGPHGYGEGSSPGALGLREDQEAETGAGLDDEENEHGWADAEAGEEEEESLEEVTVERMGATEGGPNEANEEAPSLNDSHGNPTRNRLETALQRPTVVVSFPSLQAGKPVHRDVDASGYKGYQAQLEEDSETSEINPYAPFQSKIDWEVAQWAKLRGVGSTAASELLELETVRRLFAVII